MRMTKMTAAILTLASCAAFAGNDVKALRLGAPFSDGMILQRERPVPVWGWCEPDAQVTVAFAGQSRVAKADAKGRWRVDLAPLKASSEGRPLTITSHPPQPSQTLTLSDVLVGEVWLCSGQSNMDCPLVGPNARYRDRQGSLVAQMTRKPLIRFARSSGAWSRHPVENLRKPLVWKTFTPGNLMTNGSCSAVAAYFALDLHSALGIPIGLLCAYIGGTNIDAWTPAEGTASVPELKDIANWTYHTAADWPKELNKYPWRGVTTQPAVLWNGLVAPLAPYACRGMIWYQGCHNFPNGEWQRYCSKMHALFNGWKMKFENPDLVLRFAQLAGSYATTSQMQAKFEREEPAAAMAVICDVGNEADIHPWEKETVGRRLAVHALRRDYGFSDIRDNSPSVESVTRDGTNLVLRLRDARGLYVYNADRSVSNNFEIAAAKGPWKRARIVNCIPTRDAKGAVNTNGGAILDPDRIVLAAPGVAEPVRVRYWQAAPFYGPVYNEVNLPLGPFAEKSVGADDAPYARR